MSALARFLIVNLSKNDFPVEENDIGVESFAENKYFNHCLMFFQPRNVKKLSNYF